MILGIAGTLGAGKGTVVEYLKQKGFAHYSSSGTLKKFVAEKGLVSNRENLSACADELAQQYAGGIMHLSHQQALEDGVTDYILEAIHRPSEAAFVKSIGGFVLGVDADVKTRYERITKRQEGEKDNVTFEQFLADSEREDEGKTGGLPNIKAVIEGADALITNNGTLEELHQQIEDVLDKISD